MSDKDRPKADDGGGSGRADEEDTEGPAEKEGLCKGCGRKGRRLSLFRLRKSKKLLHQKRKKKGICVNSRGWGRRANGGGGGGWCCLCLRQPKTLDSSGNGVIYPATLLMEIILYSMPSKKALCQEPENFH